MLGMKDLLSELPLPKQTGFETWYSLYKRKCGKLDAQKAYQQALSKGATHAELLAGLTRFNQLLADRGTDRTFIPHPGTWLRQGRWADDEGNGSGAAEPRALVCAKPIITGCAQEIVRRITSGNFSAYFSGCQFTETTVIAPSQARADYIINKFRHRIPDLIVEVANANTDRS